MWPTWRRTWCARSREASREGRSQAEQGSHQSGVEAEACARERSGREDGRCCQASSHTEEPTAPEEDHEAAAEGGGPDDRGTERSDRR